MILFKRILAFVLLAAVVLATLNVYRGPHLFGRYAEHVMVGMLALLVGFAHLVKLEPFNASQAAELQMSTREYVRRKPLKAAITIAFILATPLAIAWIKNDFDWTILAAVELVAIGIMIHMWYRDRPLRRKD